jgi:hypothetical protein
MRTSAAGPATLPERHLSCRGLPRGLPGGRGAGAAFRGLPRCGSGAGPGACRSETYYLLTRTAADYGRGFLLEKVDPRDMASYHVNLDGDKRACDCKGFLEWGHCKHADGLAALTAAGGPPGHLARPSAWPPPWARLARQGGEEAGPAARGDRAWRLGSTAPPAISPER